MSGKPYRFQLADGRTAEADDYDNAMWLMEKLDSKGVKFEVTAEPDDEQPQPSQAPAPAVTSSPTQGAAGVGGAIEDAPVQDASWLGQLKGWIASENERARGDIARDADQINAHGPSPDEMAHVERIGTEPAYAARQLAGAGGRMLGGAVGAGAQGLGMLGRLGGSALGGGIEGGAQYGATAQDPTLAGAGEAAGYGAAAGLGGQVLGDTVAGVGGAVANAARRSQLDLSSDQYRNLASERGLQAAADVGELPDKLGLTNRLWPQSRGQLADRAGQARQGFGEQMGGALDRAGSELEPGMVNRDAVYERLGQLESQAGKNVSSTGRPLRNAYNELRQDLGTGPDVTTPRELHTLKTNYEGAAGYGDRVGKSIGDTAVHEANANAATAARGELDRVMSNASPSTYGDFNAGRQGFGEAALVENAARDAAASQLGNGRGAGTRAAIGGMIGGLPGAAAGAAFGAPVQDLATSFAGNVARGAQHNAQGALGLGIQSYGGGQAGAAFQQHQQNTNEGNGSNMEAALGSLLDEDDGASLGPYAEELAQAEEDGTVGAVLTKLQNDQEWRTRYLPQLQQRTRR